MARCCQRACRSAFSGDGSAGREGGDSPWRTRKVGATGWASSERSDALRFSATTVARRKSWSYRPHLPCSLRRSLTILEAARMWPRQVAAVRDKSLVSYGLTVARTIRAACIVEAARAIATSTILSGSSAIGTIPARFGRSWSKSGRCARRVDFKRLARNADLLIDHTTMGRPAVHSLLCDGLYRSERITIAARLPTRSAVPAKKKPPQRTGAARLAVRKER